MEGCAGDRAKRTFADAKVEEQIHLKETMREESAGVREAGAREERKVSEKNGRK